MSIAGLLRLLYLRTHEDVQSELFQMFRQVSISPDASQINLPITLGSDGRTESRMTKINVQKYFYKNTGPFVHFNGTLTVRK